MKKKRQLQLAHKTAKALSKALARELAKLVTSTPKLVYMRPQPPLSAA